MTAYGFFHVSVKKLFGVWIEAKIEVLKVVLDEKAQAKKKKKKDRARLEQHHHGEQEQCSQHRLVVILHTW